MALSGGTEFHHKTDIDFQCILLLLCGSSCTTDDNNITAEKWESIQEKALGWKGLDRFKKVRESVDWEKGYYMHSAYYTSLSSKRMLSQAMLKSANAKQRMTLKKSIYKI